MQETKGGIRGASRFGGKHLPGQVAVRDTRDGSINPQLFVFTVSLALWTAIIAACTMIVR